jgi:hypothetical protein
MPPVGTSGHCSYPAIAPAALGQAPGNTYFLYPVQNGKGPW